MEINDLKNIIRIFWKIIFSWLVVIFVFFLNILNVNLPEQTTDRPFQADKIIQDKWIKKIIFSKIEKKQTLNEKKIVKKEVTEKEKYEFVLNILKQASLKVHWSSPNKDFFDKLCSYYKTYCNIIDISKTDFNYQEKTYYVWITIYLLHFVDGIFPDVTNKLYYIKIQKSKTWRRWYAWHYSIVMNVKNNMNYNDFYEVLTHELGHIVDLWILEWTSKKKTSVFKEYGRENFAIDDPSLNFYKLSFLSEKVKKPSIYAKDFVGWYAMTNTFEDFAETFNMYVNHNYVFKQMAKESNILQKKYNFLNKVLKGKYLRSDKNFNYKYSYRPWDSTKMDDKY